MPSLSDVGNISQVIGTLIAALLFFRFDIGRIKSMFSAQAQPVTLSVTKVRWITALILLSFVWSIGRMWGDSPADFSASTIEGAVVNTVRADEGSTKLRVPDGSGIVGVQVALRNTGKQAAGLDHAELQARLVSGSVFKGVKFQRGILKPGEADPPGSFFFANMYDKFPPIISGAITTGQLMAAFPDVPQEQLSQAGTVYILTFDDAFGRHYSLEYTRTGEMRTNRKATPSKE